MTYRVVGAGAQEVELSVREEHTVALQKVLEEQKKALEAAQTPSQQADKTVQVDGAADEVGPLRQELQEVIEAAETFEKEAHMARQEN